MARGKSMLDRVVSKDSSSFHVRCRPMGSQLRDLVDDPSVRWVHWFSILPGVLSFVGLALHHTVYRGRWFVTAESLDATSGSSCRIDGLTKEEALVVFDDLVEALQRHGSHTNFQI